LLEIDVVAGQAVSASLSPGTPVAQ